MRRDKWKVRKFGDYNNQIESDVLPLVEEQWRKYGFSSDVLLDEKNNWYIPTEKDEDYPESAIYDWMSFNNTWNDLIERSMHKWNGCINPNTGTFFTSSQAITYLAPQYMRRYIPYDRSDMKWVRDKDSFWSLPEKRPVSNGWLEWTRKDVTWLVQRAVAWTILQHCRCYILDFKDEFISFDAYLEDVKNSNDKYYDYELWYDIPEEPMYITEKVRKPRKQNIRIAVRKGKHGLYIPGRKRTIYNIGKLFPIGGCAYGIPVFGIILAVCLVIAKLI